MPTAMGKSMPTVMENSMDKSVPLVKLLMTREDSVFPIYRLPDGYTFCMYRDGMEKDWARIESSVGEFPDEHSALVYFEKEFMSDKDGLYKRMVFVNDEALGPVGTVTAWYGDMFGDWRSKLHWFAVTPASQGRGLAKPLLTKCMQIFQAAAGDTRAYLGVQTWSYRAVRLYAHFGFSPYYGAQPADWFYSPEDYEQINYMGWTLVNGKIIELLAKKNKGMVITE